MLKISSSLGEPGMFWVPKSLKTIFRESGFIQTQNPAFLPEKRGCMDWFHDIPLKGVRIAVTQITKYHVIFIRVKVFAVPAQSRL